ALRLAERGLASSQRLRAAVTELADDPSPRVRFQLAFTLGEANTPEVVAALARIARQDVEDRWSQLAVLSSCRHTAPALLESLTRDSQFVTRAGSAALQLLTRLAALVGAHPDDARLAGALDLLAVAGKNTQPWQFAILD